MRAVIIIEGGCVQDVLVDEDVDVVLVDYDTEIVDDEDWLREYRGQQASVSELSPRQDRPEDIDEAFRLAQEED